MDPKKKIFLNLIIFGLFSSAFIFGVLPYLLGQIQEASKDLIFFKQRFLTLQKEEKNLQQLKAVYQTYEPHFKEISQVFVNYEGPVKFIEFLEKTAQISQQEIDISLSYIKKEKENEFWPSLAFRISTKGSFPDFLKFLSKLENSPYLVEILNLNIKKTTKTPQISPKSEVESNILIKVFAKHEEI